MRCSAHAAATTWRVRNPGVAPQPAPRLRRRRPAAAAAAGAPPPRCLLCAHMKCVKTRPGSVVTASQRCSAASFRLPSVWPLPSDARCHEKCPAAIALTMALQRQLKSGHQVAAAHHVKFHHIATIKHAPPAPPGWPNSPPAAAGGGLASGPAGSDCSAAAGTPPDWPSGGGGDADSGRSAGCASERTCAGKSGSQSNRFALPKTATDDATDRLTSTTWVMRHINRTQSLKQV